MYDLPPRVFRGRRKKPAASSTSSSSTANDDDINKWRQSMVPSAETLDAIRQLQAILPPPDWEGGKAESEEEQHKRLKTHALHELIKTEKDYVNDLKIVITVFFDPLTKEGILTMNEITAIFSNIKIIYSINLNLLNDLQKISVKGDEGKQVGTIFESTADYLKVYTQYCSNQEKCVSTLARAEKTNKALSAFLDAKHHDKRCRNLLLSAFLIKPIQRICKYPLLLGELVKHTPAENPEYKQLKEAQEKISRIVAHVNEQKRIAENLQELLSIQTMISRGKASIEETNLFKRGRVFISEASFEIFDKKRNKKLPRHFFFIF